MTSQPTDLRVRLARREDVPQLVALRRDFTFEDLQPNQCVERPEYQEECRAFLIDAITGGRWQIWIAEISGQVISHAFVALVDKVPRPVREHARIAYLTNVYTRPEILPQGVGAQVVRQVQAAAQEIDVELIIVWPSEESMEFYKRAGFVEPSEPLVWPAEPEATS